MHVRGPPERDRTGTHTSEPFNISQFRFWTQNPCLGPGLMILITGVIFIIVNHSMHARGPPGPDRIHTYTSEPFNISQFRFSMFGTYLGGFSHGSDFQHPGYDHDLIKKT